MKGLITVMLLGSALARDMTDTQTDSGNLNIFSRRDPVNATCYEYVLVMTYQPLPDLNGYVAITDAGEIRSGLDFVTETFPYDGSVTTTQTLIPTNPDEEPGYIIIETPKPSGYEPEMSGGVLPFSTGPIIPTVDTTAEVTEPTQLATTPTTTTAQATSGTSTASSTSSPAGPTFSCDEGGYLVQGKTLYRLDLTTGENPAVSKKVGTAGSINAMGYNALDNFLYAFQSLTGENHQQLIRIDADGLATPLPLVVDAGLTVGDIDDQGQFWVSQRGSRWQQIDLKPGSPTYGTSVDSGTSSGSQIADWAYLKDGGDYLYAIALGKTAVAVKWSRTTHAYTTITDYGSVTGAFSAGFGAVYAVGDELWGSNNNSGDIFAFPVLGDGQPRNISGGPDTSSNDGARCYLAPSPLTVL